jgi:hypothetical protein
MYNAIDAEGPLPQGILAEGCRQVKKNQGTQFSTIDG